MKRISSIIMTVALMLGMVIALGGPPVEAATTYTHIGGSTTITKNLVVNSDANIPDITFGYTITRGTPVAATASTIEILASDITATIGNAVFTNSDTANTRLGLPTDADPTSPTGGKKYVQKNVTVDFPVNSFTKPGVYRYVINETNGGKPGVTYDETPRFLDVFVVADPSTNTLSVDSYVLRNAQTNIGTNGVYETEPNVKSADFTNTITQCDFEFKKEITGNQGDKDKRFTFTLSIANAIPGDYPIVATKVTNNPTAITVASDGTFTGTYDLTDGSSLKVQGLNKDATCTVSEDAQDYTATHVVDSGSSVSGSSYGPITLADADHSVAFTNTRNGIIPTGIIFTIAPFAIGMLLFGALGITLIARGNQRRYDL
ncbi:MAG: hypothetical protein IJI25_10560 [Eubacterium sp.]|nr:hypothetical protein [Eubacterium sp.]